MDYLKIVYELLEEDKSKIPFLVILFLLTSFIDALSIAILLPFIQFFQKATQHYIVILIDQK